MPVTSETPTGFISVIYGLGGEHLDPPRVADLIGITPTEMHRREPDGRNKGYGWLDINASFDAGDLRYLRQAINAAVTEALSRLQPSWSILCELGTQYHAELHVGAHINGRYVPNNPHLHGPDPSDPSQDWGVEVSLLPSVVRPIVDLNAVVSIAVHCHHYPDRLTVESG